jgi:hypothetical protein
MPELILDYRHCGRQRPLFIRHAEVEALALQVREQLVAPEVDRLSLDTLGSVSRLMINGVSFDLFIGLDEVIHDEDGNPVLGVCEYDPGVPDTAMLSVSPVLDDGSTELMLSTLAHELGHAVFDSPGWMVDAARGPGLFEIAEGNARRVYRSTVRDADHFGAVPAHADLRGEAYFAELRANEFMGALLVPRAKLSAVIEELAPDCGARISRVPSLGLDLPSPCFSLVADNPTDAACIDKLQQSVAHRFGVSQRFVQVRMERYGFLRPTRIPD